jgi:hypothetical protein
MQSMGQFEQQQQPKDNPMAQGGASAHTAMTDAANCWWSTTCTPSASSSTNSSTTSTPPTTPLKYSNPATEETPKASNHSKKRLSSSGHTPTASPALSNMDRTESTSSLDCQSLQRSLKRVRLSSSPGELRLQLDLRHLVMAQDWVQLADDVWHLPTRHCRLEQCHVDPLRLILDLPAADPMGHVTGTTRLWLQIPRLYPHRPPAVTRIRAGPGCAMQAVRISMDEPEHLLATSSRSATDDESQVARVPFAVPAVSSMGSTPAQVLHYRNWTCILRLSDVLDFLVYSLTTADDVPYNDARPTAWESAPMMPDARSFLEPSSPQCPSSPSTAVDLTADLTINRFDVGYERPNPNAMDLMD